MSNDIQNPFSLEAGSDLSASQYCGVKVNASGQLALPSAGDQIIGVLYTAPAAAGRAATVRGSGTGIVKVKLGGTVTAGDVLKVSAAGKFLTASAGDVAAGAGVAVAVEGGALNELGSAVLLNSAASFATLSESESPSGAAGNYDLDEYVKDSLLTLGTANRTGALADGLYVGQRKRILVIAASGGFTYALTPATMLAGQPTSFTFTAVGQMVELTWTATGWRVTDIKTAGAGTTAAAGTINPLIYRQGLTIGSSGAEDRILPNGYVAGHTIKIAADTVGTGTSTISGLFYDEDGSADGVDANYNAALDEAVYTWDGARWVANSIISVTIS
jgi:hypothetical protein